MSCSPTEPKHRKPGRPKTSHKLPHTRKTDPSFHSTKPPSSQAPTTKSLVALIPIHSHPCPKLDRTESKCSQKCFRSQPKQHLVIPPSSSPGLRRTPDALTPRADPHQAFPPSSLAKLARRPITRAPTPWGNAAVTGVAVPFAFFDKACRFCPFVRIPSHLLLRSFWI
jgi:hypothetical protein